MDAGFSYLQTLNPEQRKAVEHLDGPILVLAGAGSGKTRVLTHRVAHLVLAHSVKPTKILAVTFTNKATEEMRHRLHGLLGSKADELWVATFHSCCLRILRRQAAALGYHNDFVVYDDNDSKQLIKQLMKSMSIDPKEFSPNYFSAAIDQAKNSFITPEKLLQDAHGYKNRICAELYDRYQKELRLANAMDFGDLLVNALTLFLEHPRILNQYQEQLRYILVDEFQDTNTIQYRLVKLLSAEHKNLLVVGDDDQSIYAFRGATIENILKFEKDYPNTVTVKLEQNYRSSAIILEAAHAVISKNKSRKDKKLWTEAAPGDLIHTYVAFDEDAEAAFIAREVKKLQNEKIELKDIAIFYRTNAQSRALEEAFIDHGLPYRIFGGLKFFDRKEIKDVLAYLRLLVSDRDNQAFIRILNTPARGIGAKTLQNLADYAREKSISLWQATTEHAENSTSLKNFVELISDLRKAASTTALSKIIELILERTGYLLKLKEDDSSSSQSRIENLNELQAIARGMEHSGNSPLVVIQNFLDRVSLTSSADLPEVENAPSFTGFVSFMTLHLAKGLEFPVVFFTGLEEGLLPHNRSLGSLSEIEEERRLCYVGFTRAMRRLYLTRAQRRSMFAAGATFGATGSSREVSRFVCDIPGEHFNHLSNNFSSDFSDDFSETELADQDNEDDEFAEHNLSLVNKPKPSKTLAGLQKKLKFARSMLTSADALQGSANSDQKPLPQKKLARLEDILPGSRIEHPSFGSGIVVSLDNDPSKDLANSKVAIQFDQDAHTRKLVLGKARLALAANPD